MISSHRDTCAYKFDQVTPPHNAWMAFLFGIKQYELISHGISEDYVPYIDITMSTEVSVS